MGINWTPQQKQAIEYDDSSVIVSAAAGSGKTAVLVERIIQFIKKTDIDKLLIVTFTKAAAAQMKEGISEAITDLLNDDTQSAETKNHYRKQLLLIANANICTIDSFCKKIVTEHFDRLGISPDFSVCDPKETKIILNDCIEELITDLYEKSDEEFLTFANAFCINKNDDFLHELISNVFYESEKNAFPELWLEKVNNLYLEDPENSVWISELKNHKTDSIQLSFENYNFEALNAFENDSSLSFIPDFLKQDIKILNDTRNMTSYEEINNALSDFKFSRLPTVKNKSVFYENFKSAREAYKKSVSSNITMSMSNIKKFLELQKDSIFALTSVVKQVSEKFKKEKLEKNILDFSDLCHYSVRLLTQYPEIAENYQREFERIIVDEYQDTNDIQEKLLKAVSRNGNNIFMVGDVKQSIYSFRNTSPQLFTDKINTFSTEGNKNGKIIYLSDNFRSRQCIIDFCNLVFSHIMSDKTADVIYDDSNKLCHGATVYQGEDTPVDICILEEPEDDSDTSLVENEALKIAEKINNLISSKIKVYDKKLKTERPVQYKDITILLRAALNKAQVIADTLSACCIPVFCDDSKECILSSYETQIIISYIKIIDNPVQDIPLVSVMRSPMYSFTDDELADIRSHNKKISFYEAVVHYDGNETLKNKISNFTVELNNYRKCAQYTSVFSLINTILSDHNFEEYALSLSGGSQRYANISYLLGIAKNYELTYNNGIFGFITYLDNFSEKESIDIPKILPENIDMTTITTIHKSKGLEYPIVIIPILNSKLTVLDFKNRCLFEKKIGLGISYYNYNENIEIESPVREAMKIAIKDNYISEEIKVLYVGLTRAKERLILIGTANNTEKFQKKLDRYLAYNENIPPFAIKNASSYLEWIMCSIKPGTTGVTIEFPSKINLTEPAEDDKNDFEFLPEKYEEVAKALEFKYPYEQSEIFSKYTVSEVKKLMSDSSDAEEYFKNTLPLKSIDEGNTAAYKGTVIHAILEKMDFHKMKSTGDIDAFITELLNTEYISEEDIKGTDISMLYDFIKTPLCEMLSQSDEVYKERSFNILLNDVFENQSEPIQLQGVIDCYFKHGDEYIILDFKTDKITDSNIEIKNKIYSKQLEFYKKAVEKIHNTDKISSYICYLNGKRYIKTS